MAVGSVGAWFAQYRYWFYAFTFTMLGISFYRIYVMKVSCVGRKTLITLWIVAGLSVSMTLYSIIKHL